MGIQVRAEIYCISYTFQNLNNHKLNIHLGNVGYEIIRYAAWSNFMRGCFPVDLEYIKLCIIQDYPSHRNKRKVGRCVLGAHISATTNIYFAFKRTFKHNIIKNKS